MEINQDDNQSVQAAEKCANRALNCHVFGIRIIGTHAPQHRQRRIKRCSLTAAQEVGDKAEHDADR